MAIIKQYLDSRNGNVERYIGGPPKNCLTADQINKSIEIISQLMKNDNKELCLYIKFGFTNEEYYSYRDGSINSMTIASGMMPANLEEKLNEFVGEASRYNAAFKIPGWVSYDTYKTTHDNILQVFIKIEYREGILEPVEDEEESTFMTDNPFSTFLTEAYVGKEAVQPLFDQLKLIRKSIKNKQYSTNFNISKEILKFNRLAEKMFGYETFSLSISPSNSINAYAINTAIYQTEEERKKLINSLKVSSSTGFKYDKMGRISVLITLNMGTINFEDLTDEEIMGIVLHEIGHTFFQAIVGTDVAAARTKLSKAIHIVNKMIIDKISSGKDVNINEIINDVKSIPINTITKITSSIGSFVKNVKQKISPNNEAFGDTLSRSEYEYTNEKFADTFAAIYGYGTDVHSGLLKMQYVYAKEFPESKNPVIAMIKIMNRNFFDTLEYILHIQDEHPQGLARIKTSIEYVKRELAKQSLDPKMKMELVKQLEDLNKLIEDYINFPKDEDSMSITRQYYIQLYKKFGGDRREKNSNNSQLFDQIDKRFAAQQIENDFFGNQQIEKDDPKKDIFRFLQMGDAYFEKETEIVTRMVNLNITSRKKLVDTSKPQLIEAIGADSKSAFQMKIAKDYYQWVKENGWPLKDFPESMDALSSLFQLINAHTNELILDEIKYWKTVNEDHEGADDYIDSLRMILGNIKKCQQGKECVLRIGHGSGWRFITGAWSERLDKFEEEIVPVARPNNYRYQEYVFPKSRRLDEDGDILGFVKLSIDKE